MTSPRIPPIARTETVFATRLSSAFAAAGERWRLAAAGRRENAAERGRSI